ncbi:carbohydrate ABC transporter permease [Fischerella thermalis]|jgi:multiple sugar transport system permease protein|uniref:ABC-type transporter, integral membrane subunit n=1 Tax=Fischerella thermalis JSC-11 TaxID=741277 RepID=G6FUQ2_9CYAN|nr:sugar ABC transporter permease [Fischerella thermalis]PLZ81300.1 sugar ABC transporter permease [Fischerella thermalis WC217]PMB02475.1 sugar ABC transporter permease [Fischerella thermalis CCMEE 5328]PMB07415.1 sugar ABC transporter permease [Fischerella thermalis CCMEE 5273]EHC12982.1 ABC-type transporter, integral membrane subunit [Fischerella thermalis JSC-11]PLZ07358.1 sugar ABC transporter permease [Fischerella thermalis WC119]
MPKIYSKSSQAWLDNDAVAAWIFLAPALILLSLFILWPIAYLFYLSFTSGMFTSDGIHWIGLNNYWRLLSNSDFWQVIFNTIYFTLATVIPSLVIPLGLAILLNQTLPLRGLLRSVYFLPSIISLVAAGLGFRWLFQNDGAVNTLLDVIGIKAIPWLSSTVWAMPVLIILGIWKQLGFNMVVFLAGLQTIPPSRYEAAELDGANAWQKFWHITLPGLQSTLIFAIITTMIFTLRSFEQVYVMTGGGPLNSTNLMVYYIYQEAFAQFDFGYAAAAATVLFAVTLILVYLQLQTWKEES